MRKIINALVWLVALCICGAMIWLSHEAGKVPFIYNAAFLCVMLLAVVISAFMNFSRLSAVTGDLSTAAAALKQYPEDRDPSLIPSERDLFETDFLRARYGEFLRYRADSGGNGEISDYINEEVIRMHAGAGVMEIIPDILTGLGILGTFVGLVWGLRGFDPGTYETMAESIPSLIDGIKVAFITSIMGLSLSMAYSFDQKRAEDGALSALEDFYDGFEYFIAPEKAVTKEEVHYRVMEENTRRIMEAADRAPEETADRLSKSLSPVTGSLLETMERFVNLVTLNQQDLLENVAVSVTGAMTESFSTEFNRLGNTLDRMNEVQEDGIKKIGDAYTEYEKSLEQSTGKVLRITEEEDARRMELNAQFRQQQKSLAKLVESISAVTDRLAEASYEDLNIRLAMEGQIGENQKISEQMRESVTLMHRETLAAVKALEDVKVPKAKVQMEGVEDLKKSMDALAGAVSENTRELQQRKGKTK